MTCIKTGARVLFGNYAQLISADVFYVGDCTVIRTHPDQIGGSERSKFVNMDTVKEEDYDMIVYYSPCENEFWRPDIGVFVVPRSEAQLKGK